MRKQRGPPTWRGPAAAEALGTFASGDRIEAPGSGAVNNNDITPFVALLTGSPQAVPEPAGMVLLALSAAALMRMRHGPSRSCGKSWAFVLDRIEKSGRMSSCK